MSINAANLQILETLGKDIQLISVTMNQVATHLTGNLGSIRADLGRRSTTGLLLSGVRHHKTMQSWELTQQAKSLERSGLDSGPLQSST